MSQSIRVLIGDDSLELGISWATAFKEAGLYAITRPKMGKVLVDYVLTERPAVVILDAKTPGLDVCDIIRTLKGSGEYAPVIFVTANYDSAKVEFEVMDAGADYYMIRPFDPETLVSKVLSVYNDKINGRRNTASDESDMECVVTEIIHQIGIPAHIKGYHYLRTAIMLSVEDPAAAAFEPSRAGGEASDGQRSFQSDFRCHARFDLLLLLCGADHVSGK